MVKFKDWTDLTYVVSRIRIAAKGDRYSKVAWEKLKNMFITLSFSVHPRYFKYKSCRKSDGYDRIHAPNDSMHDILIFWSMSL